MWFKSGINNYFYLQDDVTLERDYTVSMIGNTTKVTKAKNVNEFFMFGSQDIMWRYKFKEIVVYKHKVDKKEYQWLNRVALKKILQGRI